MKSCPFSIFARLVAPVALVVLAGCSFPSAKPDPTRYYLLSVPSSVAATPAAGTAAERASSKAVTVGLSRVELPAYLRSVALVLRPGGTELRQAPAARWAEPLDLGIARVLKETLQAQPAVRSVVSYPAPQAATPEREISVSVQACEGLTGGGGQRTRFAATWEIRSPADSGAVLASGTFESAPADWAAGDYAALTAKLGEAVAELGRELGAALAR
jgi:uncharacterized lipoprotein YmbA